MGLLGVGKARRAFGGLPPQARLMAEFLACAEQPDRVSSTVTRVWPALWGRLSQLGGPPDPWDLLPVLRKARLVVYVKLGESADLLVGFRMDPLVAAAIQQEASEQVRLAVAGELGRLWALSAEQARQVPDGEDKQAGRGSRVVGRTLPAAGRPMGRGQRHAGERGEPRAVAARPRIGHNHVQAGRRSNG